MSTLKFREVIAMMKILRVATVTVLAVWVAGCQRSPSTPSGEVSSPGEENAPPQAQEANNEPEKVGPEPDERRRELALAERRKLIEDNIRRAVENAKKDAHKKVVDRLRELDRFFERAKEGAPTFAEKALGWRAKWLAIKSQISEEAQQELEKQLMDWFKEDVFNADELRREIDRTATLLAQDIKEIENNLLIDLQADLEALPDIPGVPLPRVDSKKLAETIKKTAGNIGRDVIADAAIFVSSEVLARVIVRLGISAGIVGGGAAGSGASAGITIVLGLVIDMLVSWVYDWAFDPEGKIVELIGGHLNQMRAELIEGKTDQPGLQKTLTGLVDTWADGCGKALETVLLEGK